MASDDKKVYRATTKAPVNIAVVKYWGKRDKNLNLPTNSSLSVTLSPKVMSAHTTASCSASFPPGDTMTLNGEPDNISKERPQACLNELKSRRKALEEADPSLPKLSQMPLRLVSKNNFPTAAGLASSAAGFAALVRAIADLYKLPDTEEELSVVARQGSGSACRGLMGGYVAWRMGERNDGMDSRAVQVAKESHWPNMRALILVASAAKKDVSSTDGMQRTVATSALFQERVANVVPENMENMKRAIDKKNFNLFAKTTMRESNSFHATCADTYPPIFYMNDVSRAVVRAVEAINEQAKEQAKEQAEKQANKQAVDKDFAVAAYTFDAGPNAVIYYLDENRAKVLGTFYRILGAQMEEGWKEEARKLEEARELDEKWKKEACTLNESSFTLDEAVAAPIRTGVSRVIMTRVGGGPEKCIDEHLVEEDGSVVA